MIPLSTINCEENINDEYDIKITKADYPNLNLTADKCYIRTHKVSTIHSSDLGATCIATLSSAYPDLYADIFGKFTDYASSSF